MSLALAHPAFGRRRGIEQGAAPPAPAPEHQAPPPTPVEAIAALRAQCMARVDPAAIAAISADRLGMEVERLIGAIANEQRIQINLREQRALAVELVHDMLGLGPLETLLADDTIADIMVNGPEKVFVERGGKVMLSSVRFRDAQHLTNICQRIAAGVGRRVDESSPMVDARLKDGSRVNIVLPPLALDGPCVSIRKFGKKTIDFGRLIEFGAMTSPVAEVLQIAARTRPNICQRIAAGVGRRVDESSPMVDARLKDGSRVNIVLPPLALDGPCVSIRKFGKKTIDFARLIEFGAMTAPVAQVLQIAARARLNIIISGGTGSGKTTLLNALSRLIDPGERIVTVEDAAELQLQQPHVVRLETRPPSLEGKGEITQRDLVRNALRMRPDRIIIGEVRGGEAFDMLQAMNTGHDGSMSTIHANNARDAMVRIENMVQMGNMGLPATAIRQQIVSAVDLIVQVERQRDGGRRLTQVTEVCGMEGDVVIMNDVFRLEIDGELPDRRLAGRYKVSRARPSFIARLAYFRIDAAWMAALAEAGP